MGTLTDSEKLLLLRQEFADYKENHTATTNAMQEKLEEIDKRLKQVEVSKQKTDFQYEQIMETLKTLNEKTIPNLISQVEELKNKPVKRYDQIVTGLLGAVVGALGAYIANIFLGG